MKTEIDELDGQELDERLARAMGPLHILPVLHTSIDALLRDVWPVCKERGAEEWEMDSLGRAAVCGQRPDGRYIARRGYGPPPALALARAMLAVLEAGE